MSPPEDFAVRSPGAIASYSKTEAGLAALREKYAGAVFAVTEAAGLAAARKARGELRDLRLKLEETRTAEKAESLAYGRRVDAEAARIETAIRELEDPIVEQVRAEDSRREAARLAKEKSEADAAAAIQKRLDWIRMVPAELAAAKTAAALAEAIAAFEAVPLTLELYGDRLEVARSLHAASLGRLREMHAAKRASEAETSRLAGLEAELNARAATAARDATARTAAIKAESDARAFGHAWEDAHREDVQRAEDGARAAAKAAQDRKDAADRAERERVETAEREAAQRAERAVAEAKRQARAELEARADPWEAFALIRRLISREADEAECLALLLQIDRVAADVLAAHDELAEVA